MGIQNELFKHQTTQLYLTTNTVSTCSDHFTSESDIKPSHIRHYRNSNVESSDGEQRLKVQGFSIGFEFTFFKASKASLQTTEIISFGSDL